MKKNFYISFDEFINPENDIVYYKNKKLDINNIKKCSYVKFLCIENINGEIDEKIFIINNDIENNEIKKILKEIHLENYIIYAINILDNIVCEVI